MDKQPWLGFYGAAGGVTGSRTILTCGSTRLLVDCGLFQGTQDERFRNWSPFPFDAKGIHGVAITHAHLDHCGALPLLPLRGYNGPIYCTPVTARLLPIMLHDSARLQDEEAGYRNKKGWSKHSPAKPLYSEKDVERVLRNVVAVSENVSVEGISISFHPAEHILGSAHVLAGINGDSVLFSGDVGRGSSHLLYGDRPPRPQARVVVCESTYGGRTHPAIRQEEDILAAVLPVLARKGVVLLPAFAVGRAQEVLVTLEALFVTGALARCPVFLDSPMATAVLELTRQTQGELTGHGRTLLEAASKYVTVTPLAADSRRLNDLLGPAIIVSASGMLTGGRILHHLIHRAANRGDALVLSGYQAVGTRGRRIADGETTIKIFGQPVELKLQVIHTQSMSAHADEPGLLDWLGSAPLPEQVFANHGEPAAASALVKAIRNRFPDVRACVAAPSTRYELVRKYEMQ